VLAHYETYGAQKEMTPRLNQFVERTNPVLVTVKRDRSAQLGGLLPLWWQNWWKCADAAWLAQSLFRAESITKMVSTCRHAVRVKRYLPQSCRLHSWTAQRDRLIV